MAPWFTSISFWPRVPLPEGREALLASAELGRQVAALLDTERPVPDVTAGAIRRELLAVAPISRVGGGALDPATDLALTVGWGHAGQNGVTMPGKGKALARDYTAEEQAALVAGAEALGLSVEEALGRLGAGAYDVYLNDVAYWRGVPSAVWGYTIGGYQVMKKWLSYRERELLGRALTVEEVCEVTHLARCIATIRLPESVLDASYRRVIA